MSRADIDAVRDILARIQPKEGWPDVVGALIALRERLPGVLKLAELAAEPPVAPQAPEIRTVDVVVYFKGMLPDGFTRRLQEFLSGEAAHDMHLTAHRVVPMEKGDDNVWYAATSRWERT